MQRDKQNQQMARTIDIRRRYVETPIPMTHLLSAPIAAVASNVILYARDPNGLSRLIALYNVSPNAVDEQHNQYRLLMSAFTAIGNFYLDVATLLDQNLLDEYLLLERFAGEFQTTYHSMEIVAREIGGTAIQAMQSLASDSVLDRFRKKCDAFTAAEATLPTPQ
jgi:hypothetical protein